MDVEELSDAGPAAREALSRASAALDKPQPVDELSAAAARCFRERRNRDAAFPPGLLVEPEWDMLLVLAKAHQEPCGLRQVDLLNAVPVPSTTASRVIERLEAAGLIHRELDERVGRRSRYRLTAAGLRQMKRALLGSDAD